MTENILLSISLLSFMAWVASWILLRLTLDRRVRQHLSKDKVYDSYMDQWWGVGRAATFGWCAVIPNKKHANAVRFYYDGINVYTFANRLEKCFALIFLSGFFIFCFICIPSVYITDWLGIIEW